ncbi:MAG TPA: alpha/beta hydrolase [Acidimicrobiales bacterium]
MPEPTYDTFDVDVPDGILRVGRWGTGGPIVLCLHGITANHTEFAALGERLASEAQIVAPDLRGRGGSRDVGTEFSMAHHADDAVAVLDHLGVDIALVLGHSMGGFVAAVLADRHADRVSRVVYVDGGLALDLPDAVAQLPTEELIGAVIGPAMARLDLTFESVEQYIESWKVHPAFQDGDWNRFVEQYIAYDLMGEPPQLKPSPRKEAIIGDTESQLVRDDVTKALANLRHPSLFVRAPRGILNTDPLYSEETVEEFAAHHRDLFRHTTIDDVNHYTIVIGDRGSDALASLVRAELAAE